MDILEGLNPEQRTAVEHTDGPMLVVAGAGTGKTQVITRRIAYLIEKGKAKPGQVLALTFTEKAAREMEERLYELIGWQSFQVPVMTFHAFGSELLGRFASHAGRSVGGGLLNDVQKTLLLKQHIDRIHLSYYGAQTDLFEFLEGVVTYIGNLQNAGISVEDYETYVREVKKDPGIMHPRDVDEQDDLAKLYRLYETIKSETGTFDYSDQLRLPLVILRDRPNLADRLAAEYKYVLVDEYQDTNTTQDELLRTFIGKAGNLFAVGDDDQAIYGFRGAEIENILGFVKHFDVEKPAVLVRNYRSGQQILDAAYKLIRNNDPERLEAKLGINKRLVAQNSESIVAYVPYKLVEDERDGVLRAIMARLEAGEQPQSMAVLSATHAPLKALAKAMTRRGIPFALSTAVTIFDQPELIGLWYLLRWLCFQADDEAIGHVIMGPMVGWTPDQYRQVLEVSRNNMVSVEEALRNDTREIATGLVDMIDVWRKWVQEMPVSQLTFKLVFETDRAKAWRQLAETSPRMIRVFEDFHRLLEHMQDFETVAVDSTLLAYSATFPKPPAIEVSEATGDVDGVQLLTVHASKGLEFQHVYLIGCTQRTWSAGRSGGRPVPEPLAAALKLPPEHEFRRLLYVAATRARISLTVSCAVLSKGGAKQAPSPFIGEMFGEESLQVEPEGSSSDKLKEVMEKIQQFHPLQGAYDHNRLPFETADGWLELGVTALRNYVQCPFEFYLESVLKIQQPAGPQLAFGSALHKVFEGYFKSHLAGRELSGEELHGTLDELWNDRGYEKKELATADQSLAHATLDKFLLREVEVGESRKIVGSEIPIRLEIPEAKLRLRGKIDAIFNTADGVELRDFKTGRRKTDPEKLATDAKNDFQLRSYALAYEALNGQAPAQVTLDYIVTGVEGTAALSPIMLRRHREKLVTLANAIRSRDFAPNPSLVHVCSAIRFYGTGEQDELADTLVALNVEEAQS